MTGFGRVTGAVSDRFSCAITIRSVNHRFLEVSARLPESIWDMEPSVRALIGESMTRGKVDLSIRLQRTADPEYSARVNQRVARAVIPQLRDLLQDQGVSASFTPSDLMRIPDLLQVEPIEQEWTEDEREALKSLVRDCLRQVDEMRSNEGAGLSRDILGRVQTIARVSTEIAESRDEITGEAIEAMRLRVGDLARIAGVEVPEERVAQEIVLLLDRADIAEELTRLGLHVQQVKSLIDGKDAAGKKLDFLSQEILREINTLGQKSKSATIRSAVIELKTEVERIREQVQNVE
ncbi:MAG: YicC/YloC family endoribonuclease [Acidobacteriota bacterium]